MGEQDLRSKDAASHFWEPVLLRYLPREVKVTGAEYIHYRIAYFKKIEAAYVQKFKKFT